MICATNRQIEKEIAGRTFRQDLFYRINVINIHMPPLRERREDIPVLINTFWSISISVFSGRRHSFREK